MANILCVWELGSNLGHLTNLKLFIDLAVSKGHRVTLAVRELHNVRTVIDNRDVQLFQAPYLRKKQPQAQRSTISYPQLVLRQAFENSQELDGLCGAWHSIFDAVKPDLVIYDHSPSALVASLDKRWIKWVVGSGFLIPRAAQEFFGVFPGTPKSTENDIHLAADEQRLLGVINSVIERHGISIECVESCFNQCDEQLLLTIPELDHYGAREKSLYLGVKSSIDGHDPVWPRGHEHRSGPRVFVYLNSMINASKLFDPLLRYGARLLVYSRNLSPEQVSRYKGIIEFSEAPLDLSAVFKQADYFVNHANHGSSLQAFVAGVPQLMLPTHQEQLMVAKRVESCGRGVIAGLEQKSLMSSLEKLFSMRRKVVQLQQRNLVGGKGIGKAVESLFEKYQF